MDAARWCVCVGSLLVAGCNRSALDGVADGGGDAGTVADLSIGSTIDLAMVTTNSDGGAGIGQPCATAGDCANGECISDAPFTGGYCTQMIGECPALGGQGPCPDGSACINPGIPATGGSDYCVRRCVVDSDCRANQGYRCCPKVENRTGPFCYPAQLCP